MTASPWDRRIARAAELSAKYPASSELLTFYGVLARFQKNVFQQMAADSRHEVSVLLPLFPSLISVVAQAGPRPLKDAAEALGAMSGSRLLELLENVWQHEIESRQVSPTEVFFAKSLLQPYAEYLAGQAQNVSEHSSSLCPFCGSKPHVAALRPEGDGAKKWLVCSFCSSEWNFNRVLCVNCGEADKERLPVYIAEEFDYIRVDACDTCRTYIKSVDLTKNGHAVPTVDEIATVPLNLWAEQNDYNKFEANLFGI